MRSAAILNYNNFNGELKSAKHPTKNTNKTGRTDVTGVKGYNENIEFLRPNKFEFLNPRCFGENETKKVSYFVAFVEEFHRN